MRSFVISSFLILGVSLPVNADSQIDLPSLVKNGAVRVERQDGTPLIQYRDTDPLIPASILKVATAFCALETLTPEYRYETKFFRDSRNTLFVQGSGDPSLVSETLNAIAEQIARTVPTIDQIVIDTSLFADDLDIDGSERSTNPYDAKNAAFVANFSSAHLTRNRQGGVSSAEPQTPLTALSRQAGLKIARGKTERINLSSDWKVGVRYGGELLGEFLKKHGASGEMRITRGAIPSSAHILYTHRSPQTLQEIVQAMLKYSTNFTANQIFLTLGLSKFGAPATVDKGQQAMRECLQTKLNWSKFHVEEGSGLSRKNQVTASQMTGLLKRFERYSSLLPEQDGFLAKTGSLRGVNSLAGYFSLSEEGDRLRFSILINSNVPHLYKYQVANEIRNYLKTRGK